MGRALFACPSCGKRLSLPAVPAGRPVRCPYCRATVAAPGSARAAQSDGGAVEFFASLPAPTVTGRNPRPGESIFEESGPEVAPDPDGDQPTARLAPAEPFELPPPLARPAPLHRPPPALPAWVRPALIGLAAYAALATAAAAWGWLRR